jgi:hypothetical protein
MKILTAEQIAAKHEYCWNRENRKRINKDYRAQDESRLYPVLGRFNVTERAIRRVQTFMRESGYDIQGLEYCYAIDAEISRIVNDPKL